MLCRNNCDCFGRYFQHQLNECCFFITETIELLIIFTNFLSFVVFSFGKLPTFSLLYLCHFLIFLT